MYEDPETFKPERFENGDVQDPRAIVFGFGRRSVICLRSPPTSFSLWKSNGLHSQIYQHFSALVFRICPGMNFADSSLFVAFANILATFKVSNAVGADGNPIVPAIGYTGGFTA